MPAVLPQVTAPPGLGPYALGLSATGTVLRGLFHLRVASQRHAIEALEVPEAQPRGVQRRWDLPMLVRGRQRRQHLLCDAAAARVVGDRLHHHLFQGL